LREPVTADCCKNGMDCDILELRSNEIAHKVVCVFYFCGTRGRSTWFMQVSSRADLRLRHTNARLLVCSTSCHAAQNGQKGQQADRQGQKGQFTLNEMASVSAGLIQALSSYFRHPLEPDTILTAPNLASGVNIHTNSYTTAACLRYPQPRLLSPSLESAPPSPCRLRRSLRAASCAGIKETVPAISLITCDESCIMR
jgi:hypothetical protein